MAARPCGRADRSACKKLNFSFAFEACSRLIASGTLQGTVLADAYETRGSISLFVRDDRGRAIEDASAAIGHDLGHRAAYVLRGRALTELNFTIARFPTSTRRSA